MLKSQSIRTFAFALLLALLSCNLASAQTTAFTYQGKLTDAGNPANGNYDLQFKLFDALSGGAQQGETVTNPTVAVSAGIFTVTLDFGPNVFGGANRWLEIGVRPAGSVNAYTVLAPRQPITSTPYAIQTIKAASADALSSACVGCVQDAQINAVAGDKVSGAIPVASVPAGSANYIQNGTALQALSNFNISGNGLIGGNVGIGTVAPADKLTVQTASHNFGITHTDGIASIGTYVGAGSSGYGGWFGTRTNHPLFFYTNGGSAQMTLTPAGNIGIGTATPLSRFTVSGSGGLPGSQGSPRFDLFNTLFNGGFYQWVSDNGYWTLATNDGTSRMYVTPTGDVVLGGNAGFANNPRVGIHSATNTYGIMQSDGNIDVGTFVGGLGGWYGTRSNHPLFFFTNNGNAQMALSTAGNVGIGVVSPQARFHVNGGTSWFQGNSTPLTSAAGSGVAIGMNNAGGYVFAYDYASGAPVPLNLNGPGGGVNVGTNLSVNGTISFLTADGGNTPMCKNSNGQIAFCASSIRYKTNIAAFSSGLSLIRQLRPVTFDWKANGQRDVGFIAEEVEQVQPLFVTYSAEGEVQGVKYERLSVAFVNAFKEQQAQIEQQQQRLDAQQKQLTQQQNLIHDLRAFVCQANPQASVCREK